MKKNDNKKIDPNFLVKLKKFNLFNFAPDQKDEPILEIRNLNKKFYRNFKKFYALKNINLTFYKNSKTALLGPNGAGKTSLIEIISGTSKITSGEILFNYNYKTLPQEKIGIQFQETNFPTGLTTYDIIDFQIKIAKINISRPRLAELIVIFKLEDLLNRKAKVLSGGQQQRLAVLCAILNDPLILFLDELSNSLDINIHMMIINYIKEFVAKGKKTLILTSHNSKEIEEFCDRIIILKNGCVVADTTKNSIIDKFKSLDYFLDNFFKID